MRRLPRISGHAVERYHERVDPAASRQEARAPEGRVADTGCGMPAVGPRAAGTRRATRRRSVLEALAQLLNAKHRLSAVKHLPRDTIVLSVIPPGLRLLRSRRLSPKDVRTQVLEGRPHPDGARCYSVHRALRVPARSRVGRQLGRELGAQTDVGDLAFPMLAPAHQSCRKPSCAVQSGAD
jgi:hypothetical protein